MKTHLTKLAFAILIAIIFSMNNYHGGAAFRIDSSTVTKTYPSEINKIRESKALNALPKVSVSSLPYPVGMGSGESKSIRYKLTELGNGAGQITSFTYQFYTQYDEPISVTKGPYPTDLDIDPFQSIDWDEPVYLPESVVDTARILDEYALVLKTTLYGQSLAGEAFSIETSQLLLLPPKEFSKASPADASVLLPGDDHLLLWNSSVGAIDYEYCFDTIDNDSCDTDWTGTYWPSTYNTDTALQGLPPATTFYWQVRANNLAGTTYANNGNWWSFKICPNSITVTNANDSGEGSLRQAITEICPGGNINFAASLAGKTIMLSSTLVISRDLTIDGSTLASQINISGNNSVTVFMINPSVVVAINSLVVKNGKAYSSLGYHGGGIYNDGTLTLANSTVINNLAYGGGGIFNQKRLTVKNSTITANKALYDGGGIFNASYSNLTLINNTISENTSHTHGGGIYNRGTLNFANNILANSYSTDCYNDINGSPGIINININNLIETNGPASFACGTPFITGDPMLGPLNDNGGPVQTMALLPGSPAIDAGDDENCPSTDQRGVKRPQGAHCDIGAVETIPYSGSWEAWHGGLTLESDQNVVAVARPHAGPEVMTYDGFASGGHTQYLPMLFKKAFGGSYNAALYIQNLSDASTANITIHYYDKTGNSSCVVNDTLTKLAAKGYWLLGETCLPDGWVGGAIITADQGITAVGRPHVGSQVTSYDGLASGSRNVYMPMLFKKAFDGSYNAALYIQNTDETNTASITIDYYDTDGILICSEDDSIPALATEGYWLPANNCLPDGWKGSAVISADQDIVAVGRPHIGNQVLSYNGFASGSTNAYVPMLFKDAFGGSYDSALYVQNLDPSNPANITIRFYDSSGNETYSTTDNISALASKGYWLPAIAPLGTSWVGGVKVESDRDIVAVGRPHVGSQVMAYNGFVSGSANAYVPMLFKDAFGGSYDSALYVQNTNLSSLANVTLKFYDRSGAFSCSKQVVIPSGATSGFWLPSLNCD